MISHRNYEDIRHLILPGDVVAFGGKGRVSNVIKWATRSVVSHVGVVLRTSVPGDSREFVEVIESTTLDGMSGVQRTRLSSRLKMYDGEIWVLPLDRDKLQFNQEAFFDFLFSQDGKPYDAPQAIMSALPMDNEESFEKFFCSELVSAGLSEAGSLPAHNSSEVTPIDLCKANIYKNEAWQISGIPNQIRGYNSLDPDVWVDTF